MAASKPMTSVELLAAIRMGENGDILPLLDTVDEQGLLSLCNNFLVVDPQLKVRRFPHLLVREYLEAEDEWSAAHSHYHAVSVCLSYFVDKYEHDGSDPDAKLAAQHQIEILDGLQGSAVCPYCGVIGDFSTFHWLLDPPTVSCWARTRYTE